MTSTADDDRALRALHLSVAALRRHHDAVREVAATVHLDGLGTSAATVDDGRLDVGFNVEVRGADVVASGTVGADWTGECRRCLDPVTGHLDLTVTEVFRADRGGGDQDDGDTYSFTGPAGDETVDLEAVARDAVLLALPLSPLCGPDCAGPDPERFPTATGTPADGEPAGDPRWAALDALRLDAPADPADPAGT